MDWLGGKRYGNDTYSAVRRVESSKYNGQVMGSRPRGQREQHTEYSFHPPTSVRVSGSMVLRRLRSYVKRLYGIQGEEGILTAR